jgi:hypothetical protein
MMFACENFDAGDGAAGVSFDGIMGDAQARPSIASAI